MLRSLKLLIIIVGLSGATLAQAQPAFTINNWDRYDASERLGLAEQECGDEWSKGFTARDAQAKFRSVTKTQAQKFIMDICGLENLGFKPVVPPKGAKVVQNHFPKIPPAKQYRCWIDINGRHRVADDDPFGTGWCWGKAVGDK